MKTTFTIQFQGVGRDKLSWEQVLPDLSHRTLLRAVKKKRALGSNGIDFEIDQETGIGSIFAGGRHVGYMIVSKNLPRLKWPSAIQKESLHQ